MFALVVGVDSTLGKMLSTYEGVANAEVTTSYQLKRLTKWLN